jgi:hypothetical protein
MSAQDAGRVAADVQTGKRTHLMDRGENSFHGGFSEYDALIT